MSSFQLQFKQLQPAMRSPLLCARLKSQSLLPHLKHALHVPDHLSSPLLPFFLISERPLDLGVGGKAGHSIPGVMLLAPK